MMGNRRHRIVVQVPHGGGIVPKALSGHGCIHDGTNFVMANGLVEGLFS
jgi:hypothetical protein